MTENDEIGPAQPADVPLLPDIERAAAQLLRGHAPDRILAEASSLEALAEAQGKGHLWVARHSGKPVGFALVSVIGPTTVHLGEIDVHPDHGKRGLGRRLVREVCEWARRSGHREVTLTTFREVRWNMPFYASIGFVELDRAKWTPALHEIVDDETSRGLDPVGRVVMHCPLTSEEVTFEQYPPPESPQLLP